MFRLFGGSEARISPVALSPASPNRPFIRPVKGVPSTPCSGPWHVFRDSSTLVEVRLRIVPLFRSSCISCLSQLDGPVEPKRRSRIALLILIAIGLLVSVLAARWATDWRLEPAAPAEAEADANATFNLKATVEILNAELGKLKLGTLKYRPGLTDPASNTLAGLASRRFTIRPYHNVFQYLCITESLKCRRYRTT